VREALFEGGDIDLVEGTSDGRGTRHPLARRAEGGDEWPRMLPRPLGDCAAVPLLTEEDARNNT
jgi:hypothetical protein